MSGVEEAIRKLTKELHEPTQLEKERFSRIYTRMGQLLPIAEDDKEFVLMIRDKFPSWLLEKLDSERMKGR